MGNGSADVTGDAKLPLNSEASHPVPCPPRPHLCRPRGAPDPALHRHAAEGAPDREWAHRLGWFLDQQDTVTLHCTGELCCSYLAHTIDWEIFIVNKKNSVIYDDKKKMQTFFNINTQHFRCAKAMKIQNLTAEYFYERKCPDLRCYALGILAEIWCIDLFLCFVPGSLVSFPGDLCLVPNLIPGSFVQIYIVSSLGLIVSFAFPVLLFTGT